MEIRNDIKYIGVKDYKTDLFEGQYKIPDGITYNSYVILDEKIAVMDSVDGSFTHEWLDHIDVVLDGREPDYLIVSHMEPDHSANIMNFIKVYPNVEIVGNMKTFKMLEQFFDLPDSLNKLIVKDGDELELGKHKLKFIMAPMVHWPEVMMTYDMYENILFSADAFGKFGVYENGNWEDEARRYYFGIVGKYGVQVQSILKKLEEYKIDVICPLHGPVLKDNVSYYLDLYHRWSRYEYEKEGVVIAYNSVYGNTKKAVEYLSELLKEYGCPEIKLYDLSRCDKSYAVSDAFQYSHLVLATTTYNADIFPCMKDYIHQLLERNYSNRTISFIENGSWSPMANKIMKKMFDNSKNITFTKNMITILSSMKKETRESIQLLAKELCEKYISQTSSHKNDLTALYKIGYGLYVVTSHDGKKDNGIIVNTVTQVSDNPNRIAVNINKMNYSHHIIKQTGKMNVNVLSTDAPFDIFKRFGFQSGRTVNKFEGFEPLYSDNGLAYLPRYINAFMSLEVESYVDLNTHGMFICKVSECRVLSDQETMTYNYYQSHVKPKPDTKKKGYVCKICGFIYEGDVLPDDYICPLCKHGASDFEKL